MTKLITGRSVSSGPLGELRPHWQELEPAAPTVSTIKEQDYGLLSRVSLPVRFKTSAQGREPPGQSSHIN